MVPHIDWYRLRVTRNAKGLSRLALSRKAGVSVRTISRWENPNACSHPPRRTTILRLAKALELFPEELTGEAILRASSVSNLAAASDVPIEALTGVVPVPKSAVSRVAKRLGVKPDALQVSSGGEERHACCLSVRARRPPQIRWSKVAQSPPSEPQAPVNRDRPRSCGAETPVSRLGKLIIHRRRAGVGTVGRPDGGLRVARGFVRKILGSRVPIAVVGAVPVVVLSAILLGHQDRIAESLSLEETGGVESKTLPPLFGGKWVLHMPSSLPREKNWHDELLTSLVFEHQDHVGRSADWPLPRRDVSIQVGALTNLAWHDKCSAVMSDHHFGEKMARNLCHALLRLELPPQFAI